MITIRRSNTTRVTALGNVDTVNGWKIEWCDLLGEYRVTHVRDFACHTFQHIGDALNFAEGN